MFALSLLLVYFALAPQYESWLMPVSVMLAVPLALVGPVAALTWLEISNLYVQIGLILLVALSAKNAILIVEVARELRLAGASILEAAEQAALARFRPILMSGDARLRSRHAAHRRLHVRPWDHGGRFYLAGDWALSDARPRRGAHPREARLLVRHGGGDGGRVPHP